MVADSRSASVALVVAIGFAVEGNDRDAAVCERVTCRSAASVLCVFVDLSRGHGMSKPAEASVSDEDTSLCSLFVMPRAARSCGLCLAAHQAHILSR